MCVQFVMYVATTLLSVLWKNATSIVTLAMHFIKNGNKKKKAIFLLVDAGPITMQIYTWNRLYQFTNCYIYYTCCVSNFFIHVSSEDYFLLQNNFIPFDMKLTHTDSTVSKNLEDCELWTWPPCAVFRTYSFLTQCREKSSATDVRMIQSHILTLLTSLVTYRLRCFNSN